MATLGESVSGILLQLDFIFIFLLAFVALYGLMSYIDPLKNKAKGIYGVVSFVIAILVSLSGAVVTVVRMMTTWFFVLVLFAFLLVFTFGVFGLKESDWVKIIKIDRVYTWFIILSIIILLFALSSAFGQTLLQVGTGGGSESDPVPVEGNQNVLDGRDFPQGSTNSGSFAENVLFTFVHPKVLGMILIFMIGVFGITFLTRG